MKKNIDLHEQAVFYAGLPYITAVEKEDGGGYRASLVELPECSASGVDPQEAVNSLEELKPAWIEEYLRNGNRMPPPLKKRRYSGKFQIRVSPSLHEAIARRAELDGISLNSYINAALSRVVGQEESLEILIKDSPNALNESWLRIRTRK